MKIELTERDMEHIKQIHEQYRRLGWDHALGEQPSATASDAIYGYLRKLRELVEVHDQVQQF